MKQRRNFLSAVALALLAGTVASAAEDIVIGQVALVQRPAGRHGKAIHAGAKLCFDAVKPAACVAAPLAGDATTRRSLRRAMRLTRELISRRRRRWR